MDVWPPLKGREVSLQRARPWSSEKSNKASDNIVSLRELFLDRKVAFFAVPAPFTGTCTTEHVPGYQALADQFYTKGINEIVCYSVACPYALPAFDARFQSDLTLTFRATRYAHYNWALAMGVDLKKISFLADPSSEVATSWHMDQDLSDYSLMKRSKRFSMIVDNGRVTAFQLVTNSKDDAKVLLSQV